MTHAEVRERLADALLSPASGGLDAALDDPSAEGAALRDHLGGCAACSAELAALLATGVLLAAAAPDTLRASSATRARTLAAAVSSRGRADSRTPPDLRSWPRLARPSARAAIAAVLILAAAAGGTLGGLTLSGQRDEARLQVAQLRTLTVASQQLLADPTAVRLALAGTAGQGSVALSRSSGRVVVIATGLPRLPQGARYDCWIEREGARTWIGWMEASDDLAWWSGEIAWGVSPGQAGDRFLVIGGNGGEPVLSGRF
jgi:hypothetical protein